MIPKIIHFCWFGGAKRPNDVEQCIESWKKYCPDYEIICWDEGNFDVKGHPFMKTAYDAKAWAFVSDYARLKIVYEKGGIYLDTDVELVKSLDELLKYDFYCGHQQAENYVATGLGFGAIKGSAIVKELMEKYDSLVFDLNKKNLIQCPIVNTEVMKKFGFSNNNEIEVINNNAIFPAKFFDPYASGKGAKNLFCEETISIHHYSASWTSGKQRYKRQIARMIGEDKIFWLKKLLRRDN